jgi:AcrR family transcriptional regulator
MSQARLPRGRHGLSRDQVTAAQRERIIAATADAMAELGYAATPVAEILRRAGISRETFYQQFESKQDCFVAAHEAALGRLADAVRPVLGEHGPPIDRFDAMLGRYLDAVVANPPLFRLFLIESYAAGPDVARRRALALQQVVDVLHRLLRPALDRFACEALMAAVITMVTMRLAAGDVAAIRGLRGPLVELVRRSVR